MGLDPKQVVPGGWITSPYGPRERGDGTFHHGIDIAPPGRTANVEVRSPVAGEVVFTGGEYGTVSVRDGRGYLHQLLHLERALVRTGERVRAGDPVGIMGGRGPEGPGQYKPHVHYQVRDPSGELIDPASCPFPDPPGMAGVLPEAWPPRWRELSRTVQDNHALVRLGHLNPDPEHEPVFDPEEGGWSAYDLKLWLGVTRLESEALARQLLHFQRDLPVEGLGARVPGAMVGLSLEELEGLLGEEERRALGDFRRFVADSLGKLKEAGAAPETGPHLGEEAVFLAFPKGPRVCQALRVGSFILRSDLLNFEALPPGSTPVHSVACRRSPRSRPHPPCSTLAVEGRVHRQAVEEIMRLVIGRLRQAGER